MSTTLIDEAKLKEALKSAIVEVLEERKDLLPDLLEEASCEPFSKKPPTLPKILERDLRGVNLERLPYHFLFRIVDDHVLILAGCSSRQETIFVRTSPALRT